MEEKSVQNNGNVSDNGNITVSTDNNVLSADTTVTSPKTGEAAPIAIYVVIAVAAMGVIVSIKRYKMV